MRYIFIIFVKILLTLLALSIWNGYNLASNAIEYEQAFYELRNQHEALLRTRGIVDAAFTCKYKTN